jgi:hypothetical protein
MCCLFVSVFCVCVCSRARLYCVVLDLIQVEIKKFTRPAETTSCSHTNEYLYQVTDGFNHPRLINGEIKERGEL